jgi:hypothetical protein
MRVILQNDEVLIQLKATNEHDTQNILKRWQSVIEITSFNPFQIPRSTTLTPTFNSMQEGPSIPSFGPSIIYLWAYIHQQIKWHPKTKAKVLQVQFNSFATMSWKM